MFFLLTRKEGGLHHQLGVVIADSVEEAAEKIEMEILCAVGPPEAYCIYAQLVNEYYLEDMPEINSPASLTNSGEKKSSPRDTREMFKEFRRRAELKAIEEGEA